MKKICPRCKIKPIKLINLGVCNDCLDEIKNEEDQANAEAEADYQARCQAEEEAQQQANDQFDYEHQEQGGPDGY